MALKSSGQLSDAEFASLLAVGNASVNQTPALIPSEHSARLIELGYMVQLSGRLRMTSPGRRRMTPESEYRPLRK